MPLPKNEAWFPAKTHGYGWGLPARWQGWLVVLSCLAAFGVGVRFLLLAKHAGYFAAYVIGLALALTLVCWRTGEPARWRWGGD